MLFGVSGVVAADALDSIDAIEVARFRAVVTSVLMGLAVRRRAQWSVIRPHLPWLIAFGLVLATVTLSFYVTIDRLGVGPGVTIQFLGPVAVLGWMALVQSRPVPAAAWGAATVAVAGTALMNETWALQRLDAVGVGAGLLAAASFAAYLIVGERLGRALPPVVVVAIGFAVSAIVFLAAAPPSMPRLGPELWSQLVWIAVAGTTLPFLLEVAALKRADPGRVGVVATAEPVVAAAGAWAFLGQGLGPVQMIGGLLVVLGIGALQLLTGPISPDAPDLAI